MKALFTAVAIACLASAAGAQQAKFEPLQGCLLGAFIQNDASLQMQMSPLDDLTMFESLTRKHSLYLTYAGYGQPFPAATVAHYTRKGAMIQIGFEPNNGLAEVADSPYLREWARAAKASGANIFLRWASEMNGNWVAWYGNPSLYIEKWKVISNVMREEAPNVAMVWTPNDSPDNAAAYYPGDAYVDWVGVDFYCVFWSDAKPPAPERQDPRVKLKTIYSGYASKKPIMVSEWGVAHNTNRADTTGIFRYAASAIDSLYAHLATEFPRVKAVTYFDYHTALPPGDFKDYGLLNDAGIMAQYTRSVRDPYFLDPVPNDSVVIVDNTDTGFTSTGKFRVSTSQPDRFGADYLVCSTTDSASTAVWRPGISAAGQYQIYAWWSVADNRASNAPFEISHARGTDTIRMNQKINGGRWNLLGTYQLNAGTAHSVRLSNAAEPGTYVIADAVKFHWAAQSQPTSVRPSLRQQDIRYSLSHNFPNPFNPSTTLHYTLGAGEYVTLRIYDMMGREIATLVDGQKSAGAYDAVWNADRYSSGLYYCRLTAGHYSFTTSMVLLK